MPHVTRFFVLSLTCSVVATFGCDGLPSPTEPDETKSTAPVDPHAEHAHGDHDHAAKGPHQGLLIELGKEEYHAEIVHNDAAGAVIVHLLDATAKLSVTSTAKEVTINIRKGDQPAQFTLAATSQDGQGEAAFSEYTLASKELIELLHDHSATAKLNVTINGQPFSGEVPHDDHDHDHQ